MLVPVVIAIKTEGEKIMKLCNLSTKALFVIPAIFGCISQTLAEDNNVIPTMKVLWQKEVSPDANLNCSLGQVTLDKNTKKLFIAGTSFHPKTYSDGKFWLLNIDTNNGNTLRKTIIREFPESGTVITTAPSLIRSMSISENNNVTLVGKFDNLISSIVKINQSGTVNKSIKIADESNDINKNSDIEDFSLLQNEASLSGGNSLLIGRSKSMITKVDSEGNRIWGKNYKIGQKQQDFFTDGAVVGDKGDFVVVGCSANPAETGSKFPDVTGDDFILQGNAQGDVVVKDIFPGNPWPGEQPQMCQVSSGNFIVVYGKGMEFKHSDINIRAYSTDLKLLWEKLVVKSEQNKPSSFKIATTPQDGFIVAANVDFGNLRVYEYNEKGDKVTNFSMDREVWLGDIGLACMNDKVIVVYQTRPNFGQGEKLSKIKIVALEHK